jgi:tetrahydromethanopterin S-methyltransferase subunit E
MIAAAEAQTEFWRELRLDIAKKGIWGLLIIVVGLIMVGISAKLGIGTVK